MLPEPIENTCPAVLYPSLSTQYSPGPSLSYPATILPNDNPEFLRTNENKTSEFKCWQCKYEIQVWFTIRCYNFYYFNHIYVARLVLLLIYCTKQLCVIEITTISLMYLRWQVESGRAEVHNHQFPRALRQYLLVVWKTWI